MAFGALPRDRYYAVYGQPRYMCVGDSLTIGIGSSGAGQGGYRKVLAGTLPFWDGCGSTAEQPLSQYGIQGKDYHQGVGGSGINYFNSNGATILAAPTTGRIDVCLWHYGTNDYLAGTTNVAASMLSACALITAASPKVRFLIACPLINPATTAGATALTNWPLINASIASAIPNIPNATQCPMPFLADSDISDAFVHPNDSGYIKMAAAWRTTLTQLGISL